MRRAGFLVLAFLMAPATAWSQSAITGVVRDTSGAVLPGVTVEASSPALIEKARTVFTDGEGVYRLVDLRPGAYTVTFALAGFNTVRREGIELPASFTATVNAELPVGALEETVTVAGQSPLLDVQSVISQHVLSSTMLDALPTNRTPQGFMMAVPGVGGVFIGAVARDTKLMSIHGGRSGETIVAIAGFAPHLVNASGGASDTFYMNVANVEELTIQTGGSTAEQQYGALYSNVVPREGGNTFRGFFYGAYSGENLQSNNLTGELRGRGLTSVTSYKSLWDVNPAFGGRIIRDRLWFYSTVRNTGSIQYVAGMYFNKNPKAWRYEPDEARKAFVKTEDRDYSTRLTWQATPKHKVNAYLDLQPHIVYQRAPPTNSGLTAPEATGNTPFLPNAVSQLLWRSVMTNRLLVEGGMMTNVSDWNKRRQEGVGFDTVSALEASLNLRFRAAFIGNDGYGHNLNRLFAYRTALSYVTGSHSFKTGMLLEHGTAITTYEPNGDIGVTLRNWLPISLTQVATPWRTEEHLNANLGLFAQDQWTVRRLTLNLGVRYDHHNANVVAQQLPAGMFVPARNFAEVPDVPDWHDISPRLGVAYDLFGDGRTAIKAGLNRYILGQGLQLALANNPVTTSVTSVTRTWNDANGDFIPGCELTNPLPNGECGQISDLNFGLANPRATQYDPDVLRGFGKRGYNWETSLGLQRELLPGLVASAEYFRRWYGNFTATDNLEVTPADYDPFCVPVPNDAALPGGGGQLCGFYDVSRAKFGRSRNFVTFADRFGKHSEVYQGFDLTVAARFPRGADVRGGVSTGRSATNTCFVVDSPQALQFCDVQAPFQSQYKFSVAYPLPWWGVRLSGVFQSVPGRPTGASYVATNAEVKPTLNRDLASGANGTVTVPLVAPSTLFIERLSQLDFRLSKVFELGKVRLAGNLDVFNVFNGNADQLVNDRYGPAWQRPTQVQNGRYVQFSTQMNF